MLPKWYVLCAFFLSVQSLILVPLRRAKRELNRFESGLCLSFKSLYEGLVYAELTFQDSHLKQLDRAKS